MQMEKKLTSGEFLVMADMKAYPVFSCLAQHLLRGFANGCLRYGQLLLLLFYLFCNKLASRLWSFRITKDYLDCFFFLWPTDPQPLAWLTRLRSQGASP